KSSLFFITRPHPRSTLFPYTTLFRSLAEEKDSALLRRTDRPETSGTYRLKTTPINRGEKIKCVILPTANAPEKWHIPGLHPVMIDRKSTRLNSSHVAISYAVFCLKKK